MNKFKRGDRFILEIKSVNKDGEFYDMFSTEGTKVSLPEYMLEALPRMSEEEQRCSGFTIENGTARCMGTKEKKICTCNGNEKICDFYPEKRESNTGLRTEQAYQSGLNTAWEAARKMLCPISDGGIPLDIFRDKFDVTAGAVTIIKDISVQEALAKIAEYEESEKIHVGDEVCNKVCTGLRGIVISLDGRGAYVLTKHPVTVYATEFWGNDVMEKTGRTVSDELHALFSHVDAV